MTPQRSTEYLEAMEPFINIHYAPESTSYTDEYGTAYDGPAVCGAIGSYATHYPVLVNCDKCRQILREKGK